MATRSNKVSSYTNPAFEDDRFLNSGEDCVASVKTLAQGNGQASFSVGPIPDEMEEYQGVFSSSGNSDAWFLQLRAKYWTLCALVVAHVMLTGYIDPLNTSENLTQLILYFVQVGFLVGVMMGFFLLTSNSLFIKLSRYDFYFSEFRMLYTTFAVELALMLTVKIYQGVQLYSRGSYLNPWLDPAFNVLWVLQRIVLLLFWVITVTNADLAFDPRLYDVNYIAGLSHPAEK